MNPVRRLSACTPLVLASLGLAVSLAGCGGTTVATAGKGQIAAVGAENEYANVISQIGGRYVAVTAIESNPNTDPHTFEASPSVAQAVGAAKLVVQNGVGYDSYMNKIESAQPSSARKVIVVQNLLGLPDSTPNPHLWYGPRHDAGRGARAGRGPRRPAALPRRVLRRERETLRRVAAALVSGPQAVRRALPAHARRGHRAGRRLHAPGRGRDDHDAVRPPGGRDERGRPRATGCDDPEQPDLRAPRQGAALQPAGDRLADQDVPGLREETRGSDRRASTRRCRSPATTTSHGCWPR